MLIKTLYLVIYWIIELFYYLFKMQIYFYVLLKKNLQNFICIISKINDNLKIV